MRQIHERLHGEIRPSPALIICILGLICSMLESSEFLCRYDYEEVDVHVKGLQKLIRNFGGWRAVTTECFPLSWFLLW